MKLYENDLIKGETLCKECGLCCEGIFHTVVYLKTDNDLRIVEKSNIPFEFNKKINCPTFKLPCPVFNGVCTIYPERLSVCQNHQCDLLQSVLNDEIALVDAQSIVTEMKNILNNILPKLKSYTKDNTSNKPQYLMNKLFDTLKGETSRKKFKQENRMLLLMYGIFNRLEQKYFYKKDK